MAKEEGERPQDTLAKIMLWAEVMYRLSTGEGVQASDKLAAVNVVSQQMAGAAGYGYSLASFFTDQSRPTGNDTLNALLARDTACKSLDLKRRAIGSLLHLMQDSYARGHVKRTLLNPQDLAPGETDQFQAGRYGRYGAVENFHCYREQDSSLHDKYDSPGMFGTTPDPTYVDSFDGLLGARDAINASMLLLNFWKGGTAWAAPGGPQEFLLNTVFKLAPTVTPADSTV
jgi:hypothetical protein